MSHRLPGIIIALIVPFMMVACQAPASLDEPMTFKPILEQMVSAPGAMSRPASVVPTEATPNADTPQTGMPSLLTLSIPEISPVGANITVDAKLANDEGKPIPNKVLILRLNGEKVRQIRTDDQGAASIVFGRDLSSGRYQVEVEFVGTAAYRSTTATATVLVRAATLTIRTVPAIQDIGFVLDGQPSYTDKDGVVRFELSNKGTYSLDLLPLPDAGPDAPMQIQFERWADGVFFPNRELEINGDEELSVGLAISRKIGLTFFDLAGMPVDPSRVSSITLKSSHGTRFKQADGQPRWLKANGVARLMNGLEATKILYAVENVIVDGTNVVNQNQQRFLVERNDTWPIELLLYSAHISARDAVFGFPVGTGIELRYPDGHVKAFPLDGNSEIFVDSIARGDYKVRVTGVGGIAPETPVSLSRDQVVELKVLSSFDMSIGVAVGAIIALGLLLFGRPRLVTVPATGLVDVLGGRRRKRQIPSPQLQSSEFSVPSHYRLIHGAAKWYSVA